MTRAPAPFLSTAADVARRHGSLIGHGVWLIAMAAIGLPYALERHFHVDEVQIAYNVALWGIHDTEVFTNYGIPAGVPLSWLVSAASSAAGVFLLLRAAFFALFCLCLVGISRAQPYFRSTAGRLGVLAVASLFAPLWFHGFEIRHDNLLLAGNLVLFALAQRAARPRPRPRPFEQRPREKEEDDDDDRGEASRLGRLVGDPRGLVFAAGLVCSAVQLNAFKAFLYVPVFGGAVVLAAFARGQRTPRALLGLLLWAAAGAFAGIAVCAAVLAAGGRLDVYLDLFRHRLSAAGGAYEFSPWPKLTDLALGSPLVFAAAALAVVLSGIAGARRRLDAAGAITAVFLLWNVAALALNPTPFPYNFVQIAAFALLAALDLARRVRLSDWRPWLVAVVLVCAVLAADTREAVRTHLHAARDNTAQLSYARAVERLTAPKDRVLDGAGLVVTRLPPHRDWMLHSLFMAAYQAGERAQFADLLTAADAPPVVLTNYRWRWLSERDHAALRAGYVQVHPALWVLGGDVPAGGGALSVRHTGRYVLAPLAPAEGRPAGQDEPPAGVITVDGRPVPPLVPAPLAVGEHAIASPGAVRVHWVGPSEALPVVAPLVPRALFVSD